MTRISASTVLSLAPEAPVVYRLVPSCSSVALRWSDGGLVPDVSAVTVRVLRQRGDDPAVTLPPSSWVAEGITVYWVYNSGEGFSPASAYSPENGIPVSTLASGMTVVLVRSGVETDSVTIPFLTDGQPGVPGEAARTFALIPSATVVKLKDVDAFGFWTPVPSTLELKVMMTTGSGAMTEVSGSGMAEMGLALYCDMLWTSGGGLMGQPLDYGGEIPMPMSDSVASVRFYLEQEGVEVASVSIGVIRDGGTGQRGVQGIYIPFPQMWEEYPEGYAFQSGTTEGDTRQDVVLVKDSTSGSIVGCRCEKNHLKMASAPHRPDPRNVTEWWRPASSLPFMTLETLYALKAFIGGLTVGGMVMTDAEGNVVMTAENGEVTCRKGTFENVEVSGTVMAGSREGKRVLLDPEGKSVRIFDTEGNECARLDGSAYTEASVMPGAGASLPAPDGKARTLTATGTGVSTARAATVAVARSASTHTGLGSVRITASASVTMPAGGTSGGGGDGEMTQVEMKSAEVQCTVSTYADDNVTLIGRSKLWLTGCAEATDGSFSGSAVRTYTVAVPEGRHEVAFELTASGDRADATVRLTELTFVADSMMTRYFSNGFALTKNAENYLISLLEDGRMRLLLGGEFRRDGVVQPAVVYAARITDSSTSATVAPTRAELTKLPDVTVGLAKGSSAAEGYKLTFPAAYGLTAANAGFRVSGYGPCAGTTSNPAKATVKSVAVSGGVMTVTVWVADDDSPNYGGFYIEVIKHFS